MIVYYTGTGNSRYVAVVRAISDLADGTAAASFEQFEQHAADISAAAVLQALALLD